MRKDLEFPLSLAAIWVPSAAAVIAGLYLTHRPICLLGMLIPAAIRVSSKPANTEAD